MLDILVATAVEKRVQYLLHDRCSAGAYELSGCTIKLLNVPTKKVRGLDLRCL